MEDQELKQKKEKKGFFGRWMERLDEKVKKASQKTACCSGGSDEKKGSSCC